MCLVTLCQGLELMINRNVTYTAGTRSFCGVLTCTENAMALRIDQDKFDSAVTLKNISSMSVFKRVPTGAREDTFSEQELHVASVTKQEPILTRVANGRKVTGSLEAERATVRVELFKPSDCEAKFTCVVRGMDIQGSEAVSTSTVVKESCDAGSKMDDGKLLPAVALQLLTSLQQTLAQSVANLENKIEKMHATSVNILENKLEELQTNFERRVGNRLDSFENRVEDKIDNNNNLNKLIELDVKISTSLTKFRSEASAVIANSLETLKQQSHQGQTESLNNISKHVEKTLNITSKRLISDLQTITNETGRLYDKLASGETMSRRLYNESITLNEDVLRVLSELESNTQNCSAVTRSGFRDLMSQLDEEVPNDLQTTKRENLLKTCEKGMPLPMTNKHFYPMMYTKNGHNFPILCDTDTDHGGWIIIQRRVKGLTDFNRSWADYRRGFGSLDEDFWLGNDKIHAITSDGTYELRVDLQYKGRKAFAHYDRFSIGDESEKYKLNIGAYDGSAGDSLRYHNQRKFTTIDEDNDSSSYNCATREGGGWWFGSCDHSNLNGNWAVKGELGMEWYRLTGINSASYTEMKIRRV
ncbi:tenascin-R [Elysia marginata]|uniref:Tenascin-R n=1 Tax=Elysia marginata TaxID=1093978 RepID=A0AAV4JGY4_9GAST|nr:tenascin-R [Elysia marginata]